MNDEFQFERNFKTKIVKYYKVLCQIIYCSSLSIVLNENLTNVFIQPQCGSFLELIVKLIKAEVLLLSHVISGPAKTLFYFDFVANIRR